MSTYVFSEYDIGNGNFASDEKNAVSFTISTERGFMDMNKLTTLTASDEGPEVTLTLDWKKKTMDIQGVTKPMADVRRKHGGVFSLSAEWTWSGKTYLTKFKKGIWTATCGEVTAAVYTPLKPHPFKKDELATLSFSTEASLDEKVFLVFALIHSDLELPPKEKTSVKSAAGDAGKDLAGTVAGNAVTAAAGCCTIQ